MHIIYLYSYFLIFKKKIENENICNSYKILLHRDLNFL